MQVTVDEELVVDPQEALVDEAIRLDRSIKQDKKRLDEIKAKLTTAATDAMENKNLKHFQVYGYDGNFNVTYKEKFEVDRFSVLQEVLGDLVDGKISRKEEVKYEVDNKFKAALTALFKGDYSDAVSIDSVLKGLEFDAATLKVAKSKLKGDYFKDKALLESLGAWGGVLEEELDAIRQYKKFELVDRFFGHLTPEEIEKVKKAIFVEDGISVGFEYDKEK